MSVLGKGIREKCLDCSGGSITEVRECPIERCPLHPYRFGKNPNYKSTPRSNLQNQKIDYKSS